MGNKKCKKKLCKTKRNSKLQQGFRLQDYECSIFCKLHDKICDEWEEVAAQVMEEAAAKERKAALDEGRTKNGIAVIDVYVDACWSMRSYGNNYKASSGAAAIIAISHGIKNEEIALEQLAVQERVNIEPCGIFIDEELPFIGASPDGLIGSDTCVEIKCPVVAYKMDCSLRPQKDYFRDRIVFTWSLSTNISSSSSSSSSSSLDLQPVAMTERDKSRYTEGSVNIGGSVDSILD
ncbi:hypothetical protein EVAR_43909_1 [Eumeta japonica]|uniref:Mutator-like transposase domain-containing protein n=1 Tax=Eumeta variegata TaxID=151549 RepID=A0A4C1WMT6_EUMVA|nr:hypothetical protein EVAR_43909_1 [Eumeta japonica]